MNYKKHYRLLIEKAKNRININGYFEKSGKNNPMYGKIPWNKGINISDKQKTDIRKTLSDKKFVINDVLYENLYEASKKMNITRQGIRYRLKSKNFPNYKYV